MGAMVEIDVMQISRNAIPCKPLMHLTSFEQTDSKSTKGDTELLMEETANIEQLLEERKVCSVEGVSRSAEYTASLASLTLEVENLERMLESMTSPDSANESPRAFAEETVPSVNGTELSMEPDGVHLKHLEGDVAWLQSELGALQQHLHLLGNPPNLRNGATRNSLSRSSSRRWFSKPTSAGGGPERLEVLDSLRQQLQEEMDCTHEIRELQRQHNDKLETTLQTGEDFESLSNFDILEFLNPTETSSRTSYPSSPAFRGVWPDSLNPHSPSLSLSLSEPRDSPFSPFRPFDFEADGASSASSPRPKHMGNHFKSKSTEFSSSAEDAPRSRAPSSTIQKMASGVRGLISELSLAGMVTAAFEAAVRSYESEQQNGTVTETEESNWNKEPLPEIRTLKSLKSLKTRKAFKTPKTPKAQGMERNGTETPPESSHGTMIRNESFSKSDPPSPPLSEPESEYQFSPPQMPRNPKLPGNPRNPKTQRNPKTPRNPLSAEFKNGESNDGESSPFGNGSPLTGRSEGGSDLSDGEVVQVGYKESPKQASAVRNFSGNLKLQGAKIGGKIASLFQGSKMSGGEEWGRTQSMGEIGVGLRGGEKGKNLGLRRMLSSDLGAAFEGVKGPRSSRRNSLDLSVPTSGIDPDEVEDKWNTKRLTRRNSTNMLEQPEMSAVLDDILAAVKVKEGLRDAGEEGEGVGVGERGGKSRREREREERGREGEMGHASNSKYGLDRPELKDLEAKYFERVLAAEDFLEETEDETDAEGTETVADNSHMNRENWDTEQKGAHGNSVNSVETETLENGDSVGEVPRRAHRRSSITLIRDTSAEKGWLEEQLKHAEGSFWEQQQTMNDDSEKGPFPPPPPQAPTYSLSLLSPRTVSIAAFSSVEFAGTFTGRPTELAAEILRSMISIYERLASRSAATATSAPSRTTLGLNLETPSGNSPGSRNISGMNFGRPRPGYRSLVGASGPLAPMPLDPTNEELSETPGAVQTGSHKSFDFGDVFPSPGSSMGEFDESVYGSPSSFSSEFPGIQEKSETRNHSQTRSHGQDFDIFPAPNRRSFSQSEAVGQQSGKGGKNLNSNLGLSRYPSLSAAEFERSGNSIFSFGLRKYASGTLNPVESPQESPRGPSRSPRPMSFQNGDPYGVLHDHPCPDAGDYGDMVSVTLAPTAEQRDGADVATLCRYRALVGQLESVDPSRLNHEQKLAFWINLYNALLMHTYTEHGRPQSQSRRASLMAKAMYKVGKFTITATEIEHAILRACSQKLAQVSVSSNPAMRFLGGRKGFASWMMMAKFERSDERSAWALTKPEPLVTFALCQGAVSSPALRIYTAENVMNELETAKAMFLLASVGVSRSNKILLSKVLSWYGRDFVSDDSKLAEWVAHQLPEPQGSIVAARLPYGRKAHVTSKFVESVPFDWSFRYLMEPLPGRLPPPRRHFARPSQHHGFRT